MKATRGLTLIELLICLGLLGFLCLSYSTAGFEQSRQRKDIEAAMQDLQQAIGMGRAAAISENKTVTFCRSDDGAHCQGNWSEGSILFVDNNGNHLIDASDRLLFRFQPMKPAGTLSFNSFRNRQYLELTPRGATDSQNGNFTFCPANGDLKLARQMIINVAGRTRMARDTDGDGIVENSQGKPISCQSSS